MCERQYIPQQLYIPQQQTVCNQPFAGKKIIRLLLPVILGTAILCARADIYFAAKIMGPVTNIHSIDSRGRIIKHTDNIRWRDIGPTLSHRGVLAFASNREADEKIDLNKESENFHVYITDAATSNKVNTTPTRVTTHPGHQIRPKFAPRGDLIAYLQVDTLDSVAGGGQLYLARTADRHKQAPPRALTTRGEVLDFTWSPDARQIAYVTGEKKRAALKLVTLKTGRRKTLRETAVTDAHRGERMVSLSRSPDGKKIAFITHPLKRGKSRRLGVIDLDTGAETIITAPGVEVQSPVTWSGDSRRLLYAALTGYAFAYDEKHRQKRYRGGMHIFSADLNGNKQKLTRGDHLFKHPVYSPDEKRIAFLYAEALGGARRLSLRTMNTDGSDVKMLCDAVSPYSSLLWVDSKPDSGG